MIDIHPYMQRDLNSKATSLTPLIVIETQESPIYISLIKEVFNIDSDNSVFWEDRGLKINSIKESVNIVDKKFKINNVSFNLSNVPINNKRFSDFVEEKGGMLGKFVNIYYKTQSCRTLEHCLLVYRGTIKRFEHDSLKCKIQLEDLTEDKLKKKIPISNTGFDSSVYNEDFKNVPIPICYGDVDRAPAIPIRIQNEQNKLIDIRLLVDDTESGRDINIHSFGSDDSDDSFLLPENSPLFLYKDDYFRALKTYNYSVVEEDNPDSVGWDWSDYTQYELDANSIIIKKLYSGNTGLNPPSNNEMQCVKIRKPIELKVLPNPSDFQENVEFDSYIDDFNYAVHFVQKPIMNPELSYDNENHTLPNNYVDNLSTDYYDTFASVPDVTAPLSDLDEMLLVSDFRPHRGGHQFGIKNLDGYSWTYNYEIMSTILRFAHAYNQDYDNPLISLMRMPHPMYVYNKLNKEIFKTIAYRAIITKPSFWSGGGSAQGQNILDRANEFVEQIENGEVPIPDCLSYGDSNGLGFRYNSGVNISKKMFDNWCDSNNLTGADNIFENYSGSNSTTIGDRDGGTSMDYSDTVSSMGYLYTTDAPEWGKTPDANVKSPTTFMRFRIKGSYFSEYDYGETENVEFEVLHPTTNEPHTVSANVAKLLTMQPSLEISESYYIGNGQYINGYELVYANEGENAPQHQDYYGYILCGLNTSSFSYTDMECGHYNNTYNAKALYYNYWETGSGLPHLNINPDDFAIYNPIQQTFKERKYTRLIATKYLASWNGVRSQEAPDANHLGTSMGYNYSQWTATANTSDWRTYEKELVPSTDNGGWFVWVRDDIAGVGDLNQPITLETESTIDFNAKVILPKNTLIPVCYRANKNSGHTVRIMSNYWYEGDIVNSNPEWITINSGKQGADDLDPITDRRLGLVFPFSDQEISDDIKTDTYFFGKVLNTVKSDSTDLSTYSAVTQIGAVDTDQSNIDWGVLDMGYDSTTIIDKTHADYLDAEQLSYGYSVVDGNIGSYSEDGNNYSFNNTFDEGVGLIRLPQFHKVDNYTAMTMIYRSKPTSDAYEPTGAETFSFRTKIHSVGLLHYISFSSALDSEFYIDVGGRANNLEDSFTNSSNQDEFKYTGSLIGDYADLITRPSDITYHLLEKELDLEDLVEYDSIQKARVAQDSISSKLAFSLRDEIEASKFIQNICKSSNIIPLFKSTSFFSFVSIKTSYSSSDVSMRIDSTDIISYTFQRTPIEKAYTLVNVKYKKDYAKDEFSKETGFCDGYDFFGNEDSITRNEYGVHNGFSYEYLGLEREDRVLNFESEYIRDDITAKSLRDYIFLQNCNQHNIFKIKLPLKYLSLEVGDVIDFNLLIDNMKAYGEDYTKENTRNSQIIYPFFIITSTDKKDNSIDIEAFQLHKLEGDFTAHVGSVTRSLGMKKGVEEPYIVGMEDIDLVEDFIEGGVQYFTQEQKRTSDINGDGVINAHDILEAEALMNPIEVLQGDVNFDGVVNVADLVAVVGMITTSESQESLSDYMFDAYDVNDDGVVNVQDVVSIVNSILGG